MGLLTAARTNDCGRVFPVTEIEGRDDTMYGALVFSSSRLLVFRIQ